MIQKVCVFDYFFEIYFSLTDISKPGRFVVVCGDGEFVIYTALAWRNKVKKTLFLLHVQQNTNLIRKFLFETKAFGSALEFVWADGTGDYCVRESSSKIKLFKNFKERHVLRVSVKKRIF